MLPDVVYHWRIRADGSSITQQRSSLTDLRDRWATKRMALDAVEAHGVPATTEVFRDRVLAGDLHRYFAEIPGCSDEWWQLLEDGVRTTWSERSLDPLGPAPPGPPRGLARGAGPTRRRRRRGHPIGADHRPPGSPGRTL